MTSGPTKAIVAAVLGVPYRDRVRRLDAVPVRRGRRPHAARREPQRARRRPRLQPRRERGERWPSWSPTIESAVPEARGLVTFEPDAAAVPGGDRPRRVGRTRAGPRHAVRRGHRRERRDLPRSRRPTAGSSPPSRASSRLPPASHHTRVGWSRCPSTRTRPTASPSRSISSGPGRRDCSGPSGPRPTSRRTWPRSWSHRTGGGSPRTARPACRTTWRSSRPACMDPAARPVRDGGQGRPSPASMPGTAGATTRHGSPSTGRSRPSPRRRCGHGRRPQLEPLRDRRLVRAARGRARADRHLAVQHLAARRADPGAHRR